MKTNVVKTARRGFTLIELLVVIAIIAVLASLGGGAAVKALNRARVVTAQQAISGISLAIENYYDEYGAYPVAGASETVIDSEGSIIVDELLGLGSPRFNTKKIRFLTVKEGKAKKGGLDYTSDNSADLYDPWGETYKIAFDADFDEQIAKPLGDSSKGSDIRGQRAIVYSLGPDGEEGSAKQNRDNIYSYR